MNAIDLAAALRDRHGFDVTFFATRGPMVKLVEEKGLRYVEAPDARFHPSFTRMRALRQVVRNLRPNLIHAWDWYQCLDAYFSVFLPMRVPLVVTDMMMSVNGVLPKRLPTTFGTPELCDQASAQGRRKVELMLPPIDVEHNSPQSVSSTAFRLKYGIRTNEILIVTVSRLTEWMKLDSIIRTIKAIEQLGREFPIRFVLAGDGTARQKIEHKAASVNEKLNRQAITLTGAVLDPRPIYNAADIVVGMGGSALRGMSFGKPVIVVGEQGFCELFGPNTADSFLYHGIYGRGSGEPGCQSLVRKCRGLIEQPDRRLSLGEFSRRFVKEHFALAAVSKRLAAFCEQSALMERSLASTAVDSIRTVGTYFRYRSFRIESRAAGRLQNRF